MRRFRLFSLLIVLTAALPVRAQFDDPRPDLDWFTIQSPHFNIVFHRGTERTARLTAKIAEEVYGPVTQFYRHEPERVTFVIKDLADYANGETNYYTNTIVIWTSALDFDMRGTHNWLRNVITHEFTHDVHIQTAMKFARRVPTIALQYLGYERERRQDVLSGFPNRLVSLPIAGTVMPAWFAEGVAQFNRPEFRYDTWDAHRDMVLRMAVLDTTMLSWEQMATFGKTSFGDESSYNTGYALVRYLSEMYGDTVLRDLSVALGDDWRMSIDGAIEDVIGKTGRDIYTEWCDYLRKSYRERIRKVLDHPVIGDTIATVGFANVHPVFAPDGKRVLYTSNKTSDYFSSIAYVIDPTAKSDTLVIPTSGRAVWARDGNRIVYARRDRMDVKGASFIRLRWYDRLAKEEHRMLTDRRLSAPAMSPVADRLVCVETEDGTHNLIIVDHPFDSLPSSRKITAFGNGEIIANPVFTADGSTIVFDFSARDQRTIAAIDTAGGTVRSILSGVADYRNPAFSPDGRTLVFACDSGGIFNLYTASWSGGTVNRASIRQATNVPGGAFYPAIDSTGSIVYSLFTGAGYKLARLRTGIRDSLTQGIELAAFRYLSAEPITPQLQHPDGSYGDFGGEEKRAPSATPTIDWAPYRSYDDTKLPDFNIRTYRTIPTSLFVIPVLRVDTYSKYNQGISNIKGGVVFASSDVTNRLGILAGVMTNTKFEYDAFAQLTFHDRLPGLWELGITPELTFGIFASQRFAPGNFPVPVNKTGPPRVDTEKVNVDVTYSFLGFEVGAKHHVFNAAHTLAFDFTHIRYTASSSSYADPRTQRDISLPSDLYLYVTNLSAGYEYDAGGSSRAQDINPTGRMVHAKIAQEWNNVEDTVVVGNDGLPKRLYKPYDFMRASFQWREGFGLPWGSYHAVSFSVTGEAMLGGSPGTFNDRAHALFDTYIGGVYGMQGYPYYALGGTRTLRAKVAYRFPVSSAVDLRIGPWYLDKIFLGVFGDIGAVWDGNVAPPTNGTMPLRRDAGAELRLDSYLWYGLPMRMFFSAAYGLDHVTRSFQMANDQAPQVVTYGREWLTYFGIGFDLPE
jgi:Tol biopolymer transport system component